MRKKVLAALSAQNSLPAYCFKHRLTEWVLSLRIEVGYVVNWSPVRQIGMSHLKCHLLCVHTIYSFFLDVSKIIFFLFLK